MIFVMRITFFQTILKVMRGPCEKGSKCIFFSWSKCGFIKFDNQGAINNIDWELNKQHRVIIAMGMMTFKCNAKIHPKGIIQTLVMWTKAEREPWSTKMKQQLPSHLNLVIIYTVLLYLRYFLFTWMKSIS